MEALILIGLIAFLVTIRLLSTSKPKIETDPNPSSNQEKACPPHQWNYENDYHGKEIMICLRCRHRPGYSPRE